MLEIDRAISAEITSLQEIERKAAELFCGHPQTASLNLSVTPKLRFRRAEAEGFLWAARLGGKPVGFALAEQFVFSLHLEELDVLPEHGRKGIGRALVRKVCDAAAVRHLPVTLCTFSEVPWNAPYYERLGFVRLTAEQLTPDLRKRMLLEAARGFPTEIRVAMKYDYEAA